MKMKHLVSNVFIWIAFIPTQIWAFSLKETITKAPVFNTVLQQTDIGGDHKDTSCSLNGRRSFLAKLALSPAVALPLAAVVPTNFLSVEPAWASGGATAGGAYLLSAKQRYNERVKASVQGLLKAADDLKAGDSKLAMEYFASEEGGSWKDLTAAGYLLSNAFRRSSTTPPDSLPAVKVCIKNYFSSKFAHCCNTRIVIL
jgi:hypothetical protein